MKPKYSITGFVIGIILISMIAGFFANFMNSIADEYNLDGNGTIFEGYDLQDNLENQTQNMKEATENIGSGNILEQITDYVSVFFSGGWNALSTTVKSVNLYFGMMDDVKEDGETLGVNFFTPYISMIIIVIVFVGILGAVLLKWRI